MIYEKECNRIIPVLATIKDKHKIHIIAISIDITILLIIDANGCNCKSPGSNIYIRKASTAVSKAHVIVDKIKYNGYVSYCLY